MSASSHSETPLIDAPDIYDDAFSIKDAESDYQSCESCISDGIAEDVEDGEIEIEQWNYDDQKWELIQATCDVQDLVGPSVSSTGWISMIEFVRWRDAEIDSRDRCLDAMAVLSETVGGVAEMCWHEKFSYHERKGRTSNHFGDLQVLVVLITASKGASTDTFWCQIRTLYIYPQSTYHHSFTSNLLEGRIALDFSRDRPSKDLAEVLRITLPYFREMKARLDTLSSNAGCSSDSSWSFGPSTNMANLIMCLDVAESISKLVPVFGNVLEGACGILRKTVQAAEGARAARDECRSLAEHITSITLAIVQEIGPASTLSGADINRICDLRQTIATVHSRVQSLSKLGRTRYLFNRGKIHAEVMDLRAQVDNARIVYNIRSDISTTQLLTDLRNMQIRLASRVEDIYEGQKTTHHMLRTILVEVRGHKAGGAYIEEAN